MLGSLTSRGGPERGYLSFLSISELNFVPRRIFYVSGVAKGETRGKHGHYEDKKYLICMRGIIRVTMVSQDQETVVELKPNEYCFMDNMTWAKQEYITGDEILLVLCSTEYNEKDYFYDVETATCQ